MGLCKTRQAIVALRGASPTGPRLVICPASLKLNWERESRMVEPAAAVEVRGTKNHRLPEGVAPGWVVVNYDLLARNSARLAALASSGVIVDEAHFIKNASQRTTQILRIIGATGDTSKRHVPPHVYLLTGTPMPSSTRDLFNLLRAAGHPTDRSFLSFARRYCGAYRNDIGLVIPRRKSARSNMDTYSQIPTLPLLADRERTCQDGHDLRGGNGSGALREPSIGHVLVASAGQFGVFFVVYKRSVTEIAIRSVGNDSLLQLLRRKP